MFKQHRNQAALWIVAAAALLASATSLAENVADRDSREISSFVLTEAGLAKYTQAVRNLAPLSRQLSQACAEDDSDDAQSLDEAAARLDAVPGVRAAIRAAGMTTREYLVFSFSVFQNGMAVWALAQPGGKLPPGTSMANVNFYRAHDAALQKLSAQTKAADCDSDGSDDGGDGEDGSEE